jgi:phosphatidylinositol alpha-1,6-mannosyltransferase
VPSDARLGAARNVGLNLLALAEGMRLRPQLTLSAHVVVSPAAAAIRRAGGARTVQYFYAKEIGDKPRLAAFASRHADAAISISRYTSSLLAQHAALPAVLRLIAPGVDLPRHSTPLPAQRPTVLTVSRLTDRYKGHDVLLRALAKVRERVADVEWVVIGEGPLRDELEASARADGLAGSVRFLGAVEDRERDAWLRRATVLAMPSRLPEGRLAGEGFGIVYLEAASYGKPVVAGNVAGALDAVVDGETGLLVDPTDASAVAEAITRVLCDPELAGRLGAAGELRARSFAWPAMIGQVAELLHEQLER